MTEVAVQQYVPRPGDLPSGWALLSWDVRVEDGLWRRARLTVSARFEHLPSATYGQSLARREVQLEWTFYYGETPAYREWLDGLLAAALNAPPGTESRVIAKRWL